MGHVYITRIGKYLPNEPVSNDEMEDILGMVNGEPSQARPLVLVQNGIETRYYAHNKRGEPTHNNAQLTVAAIDNLTDEEFTLNDIELLCCGTTTPDQLVPSHAAMVHGLLNNRPMEIVSTHGVCCSGMQAFKYGFMSVKTGDTQNAVCTGSEAASYGFIAKHFEKELQELQASKQYAVLPFDKEFLRWMLSDGAGAFLLENRPRGEKSLRVEWIDIVSFANELDVCMSAGYRKTDGIVRNWRSHDLAGTTSFAALRQDIKLLTKNVVSYAAKAGEIVVKRRSLDLSKIDYYVPHMSSHYFVNSMLQTMETSGLRVPREKWFTNLKHVGNVGSASIYLALEELFNTRELKKGQQILVIVPESARFTYTHSLLTVC